MNTVFRAMFGRSSLNFSNEANPSLVQSVS